MRGGKRRGQRGNRVGNTRTSLNGRRLRPSWAPQRARAEGTEARGPSPDTDRAGYKIFPGRNPRVTITSGLQRNRQASLNTGTCAGISKTGRVFRDRLSILLQNQYLLNYT